MPDSSIQMTYTYAQVFEASIQYFKEMNLLPKYSWINMLCKTSRGQYLELTPADMHRRLAKEFARIEAKYPNPISEDIIFSFIGSLQVCSATRQPYVCYW